MNKLMIRHTMDKPLPYDAEVEYLESTGTQYINTGILTQTSLRLILDGVFLYGNDQDHGSYFDNRRFHVGIYQGNYFFGIGNQIWAAASRNNNRHTFELNGNGYAKFDSTQRFLAAIANNTNYVYLFARNNGGNVQVPTRGFRLYGAKMYVGETLVRDFIPVRKGNTGYLYDKVSGQLFGNQGTGDFIVGPDYNPFAYQYLTFVPLEDSTFSFAKRGTGNDIEYSIDGGAWTSLASEANTPTVAAGHNIRWRAELTPSTTSGSEGIGTFRATGLYDAMGNTMSLLYGDNYIGQTTLVGIRTFYDLWSGDTCIYRADRMVLPAKKLITQCYMNMFDGCTSLVTAPELPATTLATDCYALMFYRCTSLTTAPELPATTLVYECYVSMFRRCTSLIYVKMLATDITAKSCLSNWLSGVSATGTFVKHSQMTTLPSGASGIPDGWTVIDDSLTINS